MNTRTEQLSKLKEQENLIKLKIEKVEREIKEGEEEFLPQSTQSGIFRLSTTQNKNKNPLPEDKWKNSIYVYDPESYQKTGKPKNYNLVDIYGKENRVIAELVLKGFGKMEKNEYIINMLLNFTTKST